MPSIFFSVNGPQIKFGVQSSGPADHLSGDRGPSIAAQYLDKQDRFDGFTILERRR
jgi:hypothetical protein